MANDKEQDERDPKFSLGTRELREARRAQALALADAEAPRKSAPIAESGAGFDPYNSSGSFDRRKHWERVGKR